MNVYLNVLRYYVLLVLVIRLPMQNDLKVVIAAGLTSSHFEQRS